MKDDGYFESNHEIIFGGKKNKFGENVILNQQYA